MDIRLFRNYERVGPIRYYRGFDPPRQSFWISMTYGLTPSLLHQKIHGRIVHHESNNPVTDLVWCYDPTMYRINIPGKMWSD